MTTLTTTTMSCILSLTHPEKIAPPATAITAATATAAAAAAAITTAAAAAAAAAAATGTELLIHTQKNTRDMK